MNNNPATVAAKLKLKIRKAIIRTLKLGVKAIEEDAKNNCPVSPKGGQLRASIQSEVDESTLTGYIWTNESYAPFVEYSTMPHVIEAKDAKALTIPKSGGILRWRTEGGKEIRKTEIEYGGKKIMTDIIFRKKVFHPGTDAQPFLRPAFDKNRPLIVKLMAKNISEARK